MYGNNRGFKRITPPVQKGDEVDVKIEAVGAKGDGIAKIKGFVLFVPNAKEGQEVRVRVTNVLRKVGFAEIIGEAQGPVESEPAPRRDQEDEDYGSDDQEMDQDDSYGDDNSEDFGDE